ncbi:MAG TPA: tripartite tricarboxylate transporter substrate binding protein [Burkholderiales bacterium]|nr:tripartite tricarboxylate transporter substrate binding protein [Burkholderiales bacterium]
MKRTAAVVSAFAALVAGLGPAHAQTKPGAFPAKPVRLVVPWPAGGGTDIISRIVVQKMGENIGQQVIVDNRSGASGIIGSDHVAKSAPDGYTLLMGNTATNATNASVYRKLPYDPLKDFAAISLVANSPYIMSVHPSLPVKSVKDFVALAKARPGDLNFGSGGAGSAPHLAAALFNYLAGIKVTHVAYKGGAAHTPALISGEVQVTFTNPPEVMPHIKAGKLRALAVTSPVRWPNAPELPTIREAGVPAYEFTIWWGVLAPAGTAQPVVERLHAELVKAATAKDVKDNLARQGVDVVASTPDAFTKLIRTEVEKWKRVAAEAKIQLD